MTNDNVTNVALEFATDGTLQITMLQQITARRFVMMACRRFYFFLHLTPASSKRLLSLRAREKEK